MKSKNFREDLIKICNIRKIRYSPKDSTNSLWKKICTNSINKYYDLPFKGIQLKVAQSLSDEFFIKLNEEKQEILDKAFSKGLRSELIKILNVFHIGYSTKASTETLFSKVVRSGAIKNWYYVYEYLKPFRLMKVLSRSEVL